MRKVSVPNLLEVFEKPQKITAQRSPAPFAARATKLCQSIRRNVVDSYVAHIYKAFVYVCMYMCVYVLYLRLNT